MTKQAKTKARVTAKREAKAKAKAKLVAKAKAKASKAKAKAEAKVKVKAKAKSAMAATGSHATEEPRRGETGLGPTRLGLYLDRSYIQYRKDDGHWKLLVNITKGKATDHQDIASDIFRRALQDGNWVEVDFHNALQDALDARER